MTPPPTMTTFARSGTGPSGRSEGGKTASSWGTPPTGGWDSSTGKEASTDSSVG